MSLLGAEDYAIEVWLAASVDPAVPRLAALVSAHLSSLVCVHLQRALTEIAVLGVAALLSPGLTLSGARELNPDGPHTPSPRTLPHLEHPACTRLTFAPGFRPSTIEPPRPPGPWPWPTHDASRGHVTDPP